MTVVQNNTIDSFAIGDNLTITRTIPVAITDTVSTAWFMVKRSYSDSDANALIAKTITAVDTAEGWIEDTGTDGESIVHFYLSQVDTSELTPFSSYPYSIKVKYVNAKVETYELGFITGLPAVKQGNT